MVNTKQISDMIKAWAADCWYKWAAGESFVEYDSQDSEQILPG